MPQNAIGVIKIDDFQKHVPGRVRASMRTARKATLASQFLCGFYARMNFRGSSYGALKFLRKAPCAPDAIFPMTVVKKTRVGF